MIYQATIENSRTGERKSIALGRQSGVMQACGAARDKCPTGWHVLDVRPKSSHLARSTPSALALAE